MLAAASVSATVSQFEVCGGVWFLPASAFCFVFCVTVVGWVVGFCRVAVYGGGVILFVLAWRGMDLRRHWFRWARESVVLRGFLVRRSDFLCLSPQG